MVVRGAWLISAVWECGAFGAEVAGKEGMDGSWGRLRYDFISDDQLLAITGEGMEGSREPGSRSERLREHLDLSWRVNQGVIITDMAQVGLARSRSGNPGTRARK